MKSNAPTLPRSDAPTLQRSNAHTLQRSDAPALNDSAFTQIPFKDCGRSWSGADCAGVAWLWLQNEFGFEEELPARTSKLAGKQSLSKALADRLQMERPLERGDLIFFRSRRHDGKIAHVAIWLGNNRVLNTTAFGTQILNGFQLLNRGGFEIAGTIRAREALELKDELGRADLGYGVDWATVAVLLAVSLAASAASYFLMPRPRLDALRNQSGRYGFAALQTVSNPEVPLPVIFGQVTVAGNAVFQSPIDKTLPVTDPTNQKTTRSVVWSSGPITAISNLRINGLYFASPFYGSGSTHKGFQASDQSYTQAMYGDFGESFAMSNFTHYFGPSALAVPVDVRASYDRFHPVYGYNGAAYSEIRFINSNSFNGLLNVTVDIQGIPCRSFDTSGFVRSTTTDNFTGNGTLKQFFLTHDDLDTVNTLTVGGVTYTEISESNPTGLVFHVNRIKGIITFFAAPANAAAIVVNYGWFTRAYCANPVSHAVFLLTDKRRGKGFDESKIDWASAVTARNFCDASVTWYTADGFITGPRYACNYAMDFRKSLQQHLGEMLNAFYGFIFLSEGKIKIKARTSGSSVFSFNGSSILTEPQFNSKLMDRSARANRVRVFYHTVEELNAETDAVRDDLLDQLDRSPRVGNDGIVEDQLKFLAVDNKSQAERLGEQILQENTNVKWIVEFATNIRGLALEPGDIIDITHGSQPDWSAKLFRIEEIGLDEQDHPLIMASEYYAPAYI